MISKIPYLIDAIRFWAIDSGYTPQLLIDADRPDVSIPYERIELPDGEVVLNVHERAVDDFDYHEGQVVFRTRFSGQSVNVAIPFEAVIAIFTRETHEGLHLQALSQAETDTDSDEGELQTEPEKEVVGKGKPHLTVVK